MDAAEQTARAGSALLKRPALSRAALSRFALSAAIVSGGVIAATSADADPTGFGPDPNALPYAGGPAEREAPPAFRPDGNVPALDASREAYIGDPGFAPPPTPYRPDLYWTRPTAPPAPASLWPAAGDWRAPYGGPDAAYPGPFAPPPVLSQPFPAVAARPVAVPVSAQRHFHVGGYGYGVVRPAPPATPFVRPGQAQGIGYGSNYGSGGLGLISLGRLSALGGGHHHDQAKNGSPSAKEHRHEHKDDDD
jgi:hypothetical protein